MIFKEWLRFIYGMAMGTSVPYIKPTNRFMWPTALKKVDQQFGLFLGGSCVCGIYKSESHSVVINTNAGAAAQQLHQIIEHEYKAPQYLVFNTSLSNDFISGNKNYPPLTKYYIPKVSDQVLQAEWPNKPDAIEKISEERIFKFDDENILVVPVLESASHIDLAVFFEKRKTLFLGALFFNHIHPILRPLEGMNVSNWIRNLEKLQERFKPELIIPAEGDPANAQEFKDFISYLKALSDPQIEFSECRKIYDWIEIPGQTSLEENFDLLRENIKSFTKF